MRNIRIVFAGSSKFSLYFLNNLIYFNYNIIGILTKLNNKFGIISLLRKKIPLFYIEKDNNFFLNKWIKELKVDIIIIVDFGFIFSKKIINLIPLGCINIHASLLPRWRGSAPVQRSLLNGDIVTGVTIIKIDSKVDNGPILGQIKVSINKYDNSNTLFIKLQKIGFFLLLKVLFQIKRNTLCIKYQNIKYVTYAKKIQKSEAKINWFLSAYKIELFIKAFNPWPVCFFIVCNKNIRVWSAYSCKNILVKSCLNKNPGTIVKIHKTGIYVITGNGLIVLTMLQVCGKKIHTCLDIINANYNWLFVNNQLN